MKTTMNRFLILLLVAGIILVASAGAASSQNYYVSTNGDNSNSGTSMNQAFATVEHGSSQLHAGDTLYIGGGTYWNDKISIERSGTASNWITVTNHNSEKVKMYHSEEFNGMTLIHLVDKSYIEIENIESSHYGSCCYISGKYRGNTHDIIINNVDSLRSYNRGYACNNGAHDILFENILIKDVQHPTSAPNAFDFLTSPHDKNYKPYSNYIIYNIELINVDINGVHDHGGFNFGQGLTPNDGSCDSHWESRSFENFYFDGCDVTDVAGAGYCTNKGMHHNSVIKNCEVEECCIGLTLCGDNLTLKNVHSHRNYEKCSDLYFTEKARSEDVTIECYTGREPNIPDKDMDEFTIIECGSESEPNRVDYGDWGEEWYGENSDGGTSITTTEYQAATHHWLEDKPVRGHILTTSDFQDIVVEWSK